jgi:hypothetical protein
MFLGCTTFVVPEETTGFRDLDNLSAVRKLDGTRLRAVHVQRPMTAVLATRVVHQEDHALAPVHMVAQRFRRRVQ